MIIAASSSQTMWYLTRGTGAIALVLLSAVVVLGILGPLRFTRPSWPRFSIDTLHRDISLLVIVVLVVHIITTVLDTFAPIGILDAFVPLHSSYRPLWLGLGALSFDLLLALVVTSLLRRRIGLRTWRAVHWLAYLSWPVAVLHGLGTGTDTNQGWMLVLTAACVLAVAAALGARILVIPPGPARGAARAAGLVTVAGIALFTLLGPLQPHWARRSGTPSRLLASAKPARFAAHTLSGSSSAARGAASGSGGSATRTGTKLPPSTFSASVSGTVAQHLVSNGAIVDISLHLSGGARGQLRVRLAGIPDGGGGLSLTGSQVDLLQPGDPEAFQGKITSLQGQTFDAQLTGAAGTALDLHADLSIDQNAQSVTGTVSAHPAHGGGG